MDKSETDGRKSKRNEFRQGLKATEVLSHAFGQSHFDGIEWKENSVCTTLWLKNARVIGIIIKT